MTGKTEYSIVMLFILYSLMHLCFIQDTEIASSGLCKGFAKLTIPQHYLHTHTYIHTIFLFLDRITSSTKIEAQNLDIEEAGVKLRLTIIDTPGFCDSLNGEDR